MTDVDAILAGYSPAEHRRALDTIIARMERVACPMPGCEGTLIWEPPHPAEPDTGCREWRGGVNCDCCDYIREDEPREEVEE